MVAYKTGSFARAVKAFGSSCQAALVYGPDAGLVGERAEQLVSAASKRGDHSEIVRLDERDLADDPARLDVELRTIPMFADRKIVRVAAGARIDVPSLKALLEQPSAGALVLEAGALRPDSALRKLFEGHAKAAAIACYSDDNSVSDLIDEEFAKARLTIDSETRAYLADRLGADQALSRMELVKLALYAGDRGEVVADDIDAGVGDSAEIAIENFVYAVSGSVARDALRELGRLAAAGTDVQSAVSALGRHFTQLHRAAAILDGGGSTEQVFRGMRPRPHFKREAAFVTHAKRLGPRRLFESLPLIQDALKQARLAPDLQHAHAEQLVLALTRRPDDRDGPPATRA